MDSLSRSAHVAITQDYDWSVPFKGDFVVKSESAFWPLELPAGRFRVVISVARMDPS